MVNTEYVSGSFRKKEAGGRGRETTSSVSCEGGAGGQSQVSHKNPLRALQSPSAQPLWLDAAAPEPRTVPRTSAGSGCGSPGGEEGVCTPTPAPPRPPHQLHRGTAASPSPGVSLIGNRACWGSIYDNPSPQTGNICPHHSTACPAQLSLTLRGPTRPGLGNAKSSGEPPT